jgi:hypothetical protein
MADDTRWKQAKAWQKCNLDIEERGLRRKLVRHIICPDPSIQNLLLIQPPGMWNAPSNMVWESSLWDGNLHCQNAIDLRWNFDRLVTVHLPEALPIQTPKTIFDASPTAHSAMVPRLAVRADVSGSLGYTADSMLLAYSTILPSPTLYCRMT